METSEHRCPFCCEVVQPAARKCPHCQEYLDPSLAPPLPKPPAQTSPFSIASFALALVSPLMLFFPAPVAVLLGIVGLLDRKATQGRGMAIVGLVLGLLWTLLLLLVLVAILAAIAELGALPSPASPREPLF